MTADLLSYGVPTVLATVAGAVSGGLTAWMLGKARRPEPASELVTTGPEDKGSDTDEFLDAEIDVASVRWAEDNNQPPEAAGLMAARLKTLHKIGKGKGWL